MKRYPRRLFRLACLLLLLAFVTPPASTQQIPPETPSGRTIPPARRGADLIPLAQAQGMVKVIVNLSVPFIPEGSLINPAVENVATSTRVIAQRSSIAAAKAAVLQGLLGANMTVTAPLDGLPGMAITTDALGLQRLLASPLVSSVYEDIALPPTMGYSLPLINASSTGGAWDQGVDGSSFSVVVMDTGTLSSHEFLSGKVVAEACFSTNTTGNSSLCPGGASSATGSGAADPFVRCVALTSDPSECDHGTHVAGTVAGNWGFYNAPSLIQPIDMGGVARGATLIPIQVFTYIHDCDPGPGVAPCVSAYTSNTLSALNYVYNTLSSVGPGAGAYNIAAINLSLGGGEFFGSNCDSADPTTQSAIANLRAVGIATAVSSGNDGFLNSMSRPGCLSASIAVGATEVNYLSGPVSNWITPSWPDDLWCDLFTSETCYGSGVEQVATFSNSSPALDLLAPGFYTESAVLGAVSTDTDEYWILAGTSMAAPHVAGAWAVLKQQSPVATTNRILATLQDTGVAITDSAYTGNTITFPPASTTYRDGASGSAFSRIDVLAAIVDLGRDFGDAPNNYATTIASNGPRHIRVPEYYLGAGADSDGDGTPGVDDGDDGVTFPTMTIGANVNINVTASVAQAASSAPNDTYLGRLYAWIDFNRDGDFADAGEQIANGILMTGPYPQAIPVSIPAGASAGSTWARFRYSTQTGLSFTGQAYNGEVEDYNITLVASAPEIVVESPGSVNIADGGSYDLGSTTVGTPINRAITVRNTGAGDLTISTNPPTTTGNFTAGAFGSTTIASGGSTTFTLTCTATSGGAPVTGTVSFANNDDDENPFNFDVSCTVDNSATRTVTTTADTDDGFCNSNCSLREAINAANNRPGADTINFSLTTPATITLGSALPNIASDITISGPGASSLTINGNNAARVFRVLTGSNFTLGALTVSQGRSTDLDGGGGLYNSGTSILNSVVFSSNSTSAGQYGGAIFNQAGTLTVNSSAFTGNSAAFAGGAIFNWRGTVTINDSTFSGNSADAGGAVSNYTSDSATTQMTINRSLIANNEADTNGGGVLNDGGNANVFMTIANSTVSGNTAGGEGGGIWSNANNASVTLINTTVTANTAASGGRNIHHTAGAFNIANSIVANLTSGSNCAGTLTDIGYNLEFPGTSCNFTTNAVHADPLLSALANNGGPTQTHALPLGSPAVDAGNNTTCAAAPISNVDQRGAARPFDGNGDLTATCDIGAYERDTAASVFSINDVSASEGSSPFTFTVTRGGSTSGTSTVDYATSDGTASAASDYTSTSATLTFGDGVTTQTVEVTIIGDLIFEPDETFFVNLSNPTNALISDGQGQGTIENDEATPSLSVNSPILPEDVGGSGQFTVTLNPASSVTINVDYTIADDTAASPDDYTAVMSGTLVFDPGETTRTIPFTIIDDALAEGAETFDITLSNATGGAVIGTASGATTITDNDGTPSISVDSPTIDEDAGSGEFVVTMTLASGTDTTISFIVTDGSATSPDDYAMTSTSPLTIPAGSTNGSVTFDLVDDDLVEGSETFTITLTDPFGGGDVVGTATIIDDETIIVNAPSDLTAVGMSFTEINLTWVNHHTNASENQIERSPDGVTGWEIIDTIAPDDTQYVSGELTCGTTYFYRIRAYLNTGGFYSDYSNIASASTNACSAPGVAPLRHYFTTDTPTLTWNPLTGVTTYDVQIADNPSFTGATTHSAINGLSFTTPSLPNGVHYWRVRAAGAANWSAGQGIVVAAAP